MGPKHHILSPFLSKCAVVGQLKRNPKIGVQNLKERRLTLPVPAQVVEIIQVECVWPGPLPSVFPLEKEQQ